MSATEIPSITQTVEIDAPQERVWSLIRDPRKMSRWSPQTVRSILRGRGPIGEGSRFLNINKRGLLVWPTRTTVVRFVPGEEIAWRVKDNYTIWSLRCTPNGTGGTTLIQTREAPQGLSDISVTLTDRFFGGVDDFGEELRADMGRTLARIKADAEA